MTLALFPTTPVPGPTLSLRSYQQECVARLIAYRRRPAKGAVGSRALVGLPTGCGKTVIFSQLPKLAKKRTLVIAHREELLDQAARHLASASPAKTVAVEQAERHAGAADIVVASIQTLSASGGERLRQLNPLDFSLVIVDEAHHSIARTYVQALNHFGLAPDVSDLSDSDFGRSRMSASVMERFEAFRPSNLAFLAGFTATPHRTDGQGLEAVYDEIAYSATIESMIRDGWLCKIKGLLVYTNTDISAVKSRMGDFQEKALSKSVNTPERNHLAVEAYKSHAYGRQALIFCVDVEHVHAMAAVWNTAGVPTGAVTGETSSSERHHLIAAYKGGDLRALANCMVLTEGFDAPETSCIVMARPTKSGLLYTQMMGRGTRIAPGKPDLLMLDLVDLAAKGARVQSANTLFGLPPKLVLGNKDVLEAQDEIALRTDGGIPLPMLDEIESFDEIAVKVREFNPLDASRYDPVLHKARLTWISTSYGYTCSLLDRGQLGVVVDLLGHASVRYQPKGNITQTLSDNLFDAEMAIGWAEAWVGGNAPEVEHVLQRDARWHGDPPSQKQLNLLRYLGVKPLPENLTKGWASALIEQAKDKPENEARVWAMENQRHAMDRMLQTRKEVGLGRRENLDEGERG